MVIFLNSRSIRVPFAHHPRSIRVPSENPNLAEQPFGGRACARAPANGCSAKLGSSDGTRMERGWYADGTRMEQGWNKDGTIKNLTFEVPMSYTLTIVLLISFEVLNSLQANASAPTFMHVSGG